MEQSIFIQWVQKYLPGITINVVSKLNDSSNALTYLHRRFLKKDFSPSGKWESISIANKLVMADVVAIGSSLPLKKRDSISKAFGKIPKMGLELTLDEQELTDLDALIAQGGTEPQIVAKLFADTSKVIGGMWERNESMFLQGVSTGITLVTSTENTGVGVRVDYGYADDHKFGVSILWNNPATATPFDDMTRVMTKARLDGQVPNLILMDQYAFDNLANSKQFRDMYGFSVGIAGNALIPVLDLDQLNLVLKKRFSLTAEIVERSMLFEKDGIRTPTKPWAEGAVVFLQDGIIGSLTYSKLAEQNHPVAGVEYNLVDDFILVSKYRTNKPVLGEWTSAQARVVPVIANVEQIYLLNTKTIQG